MPFIQQYGNVDVFLSGSNSSLPMPFPVKYKSNGLSLFYGNTGGLDYFKIAKAFSPYRIFKEAKNLPVEKYDIVINDFESITTLACKLKGVPCVHFGHQASFQSAHTPRPNKKDMMGELILKNYASGTVNVGLHFDAYDDFIFAGRIMEGALLCFLRQRGLVASNKLKKEDSDRMLDSMRESGGIAEGAKDEKFIGAYVKDPQVGMHKWVMSFDLNSLYPHLIMQFNVSPETLVDEKHPTVTVDKILNKEITFEMYKDYAVCPNGAMYRKDIRGFLPELMEKMYNDRVIFKEKMIEAKKQYEKKKTKELEKEISRCNNIQMAKKIALNSAYGSVGNEWFRYFKLANAEAITLSGQVAIRWIENKMNTYFNKLLKTKDFDYVIASDSDSIYLNMGPLVETVYEGREKTTEGVVSFLDKICKVELEKYIEGCYQELAEYMNAYDQKMQMKRENIADRGIWTAKKRYILNVWDSEGVRYSEPKLKMMGIEAVKSSTPAPCRKMIKDGLKIMMSGTEDEVIRFIDKCLQEFKSLPPEQIAFPRTASDIRKYSSNSGIYSKGTPIHVRGSLLFNHHIKEKKLTNKYSLINNGEKVKYIFLKKPNIIQENVISFISEFPKELGLDKYIDYELQFEKAFLDPLKTILNIIGWQEEKTVNLESFFF